MRPREEGEIIISSSMTGLRFSQTALASLHLQLFSNETIQPRSDQKQRAHCSTRIPFVSKAAKRKKKKRSKSGEVPPPRQRSIIIILPCSVGAESSTSVFSRQLCFFVTVCFFVSAGSFDVCIARSIYPALPGVLFSFLSSSRARLLCFSIVWAWVCVGTTGVC